MRKVYEITFAGESFKTVLASSAEEALNLAKTERPALALVDHTLADNTGYDLCRELKAVAPSMAVLVMSSKQTPYDKTRGTSTGVDDFMDKPFDTQKLLDKVNQVLTQPRAAVAAVAAAGARPTAVVAPVQVAAPAVTAKPRSQTLSYGTPAPAPAAPPPAPASAAAPSPARAAVASVASVARPAVAAAGPRLAAQPAAAAPHAGDAVAAAVASGNGQLESKLAAMGLNAAQVQGVLALSREVVEKVVWEVVPVLAETLIKEELRRLTAE
jgi:CheY-like chemotaxis protein